ncbi:MAG TPA: SDR family NAD(P)-dependent oxidoreductase, partial [Amycolatopsis sp.]|nr:SDR family NAD(P)-dependent oxidoreductase [Amycolatopsis sp.]
INNAGVVQWKPWLKTSTAEFGRVLDINLTGQFIGIREVVPSMLKTGHGGVIVNVSSTAGLQGFAAEPAYVASKWGVRGLTKAAALEFAPHGIRVVSVHPGVVETPMTTDVTEESYDQQPIPRKGRTAEVTAMMIYLVADATYSTGAEFVIDGGAVLGPVVPVPFEEAD